MILYLDRGFRSPQWIDHAHEAIPVTMSSSVHWQRKTWKLSPKSLQHVILKVIGKWLCKNVKRNRGSFFSYRSFSGGRMAPASTVEKWLRVSTGGLLPGYPAELHDPRGYPLPWKWQYRNKKYSLRHWQLTNLVYYIHALGDGVLCWHQNVSKGNRWRKVTLTSRIII